MIIFNNTIKIPVIEDAAQAIGSNIIKNLLEHLEKLKYFSAHPLKNLKDGYAGFW